jgi:hemoglobin
MTEQPSAYELVGGEAGVRQLVDRFYDYMDQLEQASDIRQMHAKSLKGSRQKLFMFLSGWLGGPNLYIEKYGHPRLRQRHLPFAISSKERDQWLHCMQLALHDMQLDANVEQQLMTAFEQTANHMRNQPDHDNRFNILSGQK